MPPAQSATMPVLFVIEKNRRAARDMLDWYENPAANSTARPRSVARANGPPREHRTELFEGTVEGGVLPMLELLGCDHGTLIIGGTPAPS